MRMQVDDLAFYVMVVEPIQLEEIRQLHNFLLLQNHFSS